jgi:hypothetical protein
VKQPSLEVANLSLGERRVWPALLSVTGLAFWFFVGFPFANHNESFAWVAGIRDAGFDSFLPGLQLSRTYRPFGQAVAVGSILAGGGTLVPIQLFNFALAAAAMAVVVSVADRPAIAAWLFAITGGTFFAGFIYLFHLHGVFYSPVLLMIAILVWVFRTWDFDRIATHLIAWGVATCAFLFHPYAFIIAAAMYGGFWITALTSRRDGSVSTPLLVTGAAALAAATIVTFLVRPAGYSIGVYQNLSGLVGTFRATEVHWALSVIAGILTLVTLMDTLSGTAPRVAAAALLAGLCAMFAAANLPLLPLWFSACALRAVLHRNWPVAALVLVTMCIPAISPTGSPTYGIFAILASVAAVSSGPSRLFVKLPARVAPGLALGVATAAAALIVMLRLGVELPIVARFARPLLAERERTYQMEDIVHWWQSSDYRSLRLTLLRDASDPVDSAHGLDARQHRPPTFQGYLDAYTGMSGSSRLADNRLVVTFGNDELEGPRLVQSVDGRFAGSARVYLVPARTARLVGYRE